VRNGEVLCQLNLGQGSGPARKTLNKAEVVTFTTLKLIPFQYKPSPKQRNRERLQGEQKSKSQSGERGQVNAATRGFQGEANSVKAVVDDVQNCRPYPGANTGIIEDVEPADTPDDEEVNEGSAGYDEDDLIRRTLAGDHDSFEVLVRRYSPRVFNIIGSFFRRRDMIEDIAQEVFAKSFFSLASFTLGRSFEAWVAKIAVNACYDQLRAMRRRSENQTPQYAAEQEDDWLELQMLEAARDRHAGEVRQREAADTADRLLSKLEPEDRLVLVLMDRDGHSVSEISEMTGWGQSKIKVRAFRARRTLRAAMKRLMMNAERRQRSLK
jgi:RNA polymerase sigma-70 factor, ECF subfamily